MTRQEKQDHERKREGSAVQPMTPSRYTEVLDFIHYFRLYDYILCIFCLAIALGVGKVRPHCRSFVWTDPSISYPYAGPGTFPSWTLYLISILPVFVYIAGEAVALKRYLSFHQKAAALQLQQQSLGELSSGQATSIDTTAVAIAQSSSLRQDGGSQPCMVALNATGSPCLSTASNTLVPVRRSSQQQQRLQFPNTTLPSSEQVLFEEDCIPLARSSSLRYNLHLPWRRFFCRVHFLLLTQLFAVSFAMLVVDTTKIYAGRLRPDFLARLAAKGYTAATPPAANIDICNLATGGRKSFPSGHSGISFAAVVPLCYYCLHWLSAFRAGTSLSCFIAGLLPVILPITVAVSRTRDNRHNFDDVVAGSLIGIFAAFISVTVNWSVVRRTGHLEPRLAA